jgi:hypothetical protein
MPAPAVDFSCPLPSPLSGEGQGLQAQPLIHLRGDKMIDSNALTPHSLKALQLHAQPYDITARGFYFESLEEYCEQVAKAVNEHGDPVEEFQIQFIEGEVVDCELAQAIGLNQANLMQFLDCIHAWDEVDKVRVALAVSQCGYVFDDSMTPNDFDLDIYYVGSLRDLAEQFV